MPKRSTPFQAIVRLVREHYAEPGVVVTESKFLTDARTGYDAEVDVVVEGSIGGEPITISIEVNERGRRATVEWVRGMIGKHVDMPTNRLILVSKKGFTKQALTLVASHPGRVEALTPEIVTEDGKPVVRRLYLDEVTLEPTSCIVTVESADGGEVTFTALPTISIFRSDNSLAGPLDYLVSEILHLPNLRKQTVTSAHNHPERDGLKTFTLGMILTMTGLQLQNSDTQEFHKLAMLQIHGAFAYSQTEVPFTMFRLGRHDYAEGSAPLWGHPAQWIGTSNPQTGRSKVSLQFTGTSPDIDATTAASMEVRPQIFPEILTLPIATE